MALSRLEQLYRQVILDHYQSPRNHGLTRAAEAHEIRMYNPSCGDELVIELIINEDDVITSAHFDGVGCSISQASASMMTEVVIGKSLQEANELAHLFSQMILGESVDTDRLKDAQLLSGVQKFPARIKCATLAWKAIEEFEEEREASNR
ncbi:Fe-S cluster assembly sulfur transfer protein SufU [Atopobacter phocae]|uniref:Fe-S cluster assembly sulfur transfer protein SufU n=1 Tax=Atopobacter phocae TaxID=136492 RepID=UPI000471C331|nr:SUF system NifU family Fe-S cluster assembly protein [Atopobacter phocae]